MYIVKTQRVALFHDPATCLSPGTSRSWQTLAPKHSQSTSIFKMLITPVVPI